MIGKTGKAFAIGFLCSIVPLLMAACDAGGAEPSEGSSEESNAARLLSGLPADSAQFAFAEVDLILQVQAWLRRSSTDLMSCGRGAVG